MRKHRTTQLLTWTIVAAAMGISLVGSTARRLTGLKDAAASAQEPQGTIYAMLNAARAGNVKAYLASHAGPIETNLRQVLAEMTEPAFARYLRDSNATIKGVAIADPQITGLTATVRVEYVYQDRNEAQMMYLEKGPNGWKIIAADHDERIKTLIPYGTPVK